MWHVLSNIFIFQSPKFFTHYFGTKSFKSSVVNTLGISYFCSKYLGDKYIYFIHGCKALTTALDKSPISNVNVAM